MSGVAPSVLTRTQKPNDQLVGDLVGRCERASRQSCLSVNPHSDIHGPLGQLEGRGSRRRNRAGAEPDADRSSAGVCMRRCRVHLVERRALVGAGARRLEHEDIASDASARREVVGDL
jgi:hypothetical protein